MKRYINEQMNKRLILNEINFRTLAKTRNIILLVLIILGDGVVKFDCS